MTESLSTLALARQLTRISLLEVCQSAHLVELPDAFETGAEGGIGEGHPGPSINL